MFTDKRLSLGRKRGFTLTELAIVIALTALITSGIWGVEKNLMAQKIYGQGSDDLTNTVVNVRALYAGLNTSYSALNPPAEQFHNPLNAGDVCYYMNPANSPLGGPGIFPPDMKSPANNPWSQTSVCPVDGSGSVGLALSCMNTAGACDRTLPVLFVVRYVGLPSDACVSLLIRNSTPGSDTGLVQIVVNSGTPITTLPVTANLVATTCSGSSSYTVDWYYKLGS
jgi:prepilin-type N-terminal cleavage/methylation domain-containing protein